MLLRQRKEVELHPVAACALVEPAPATPKRPSPSARLPPVFPFVAPAMPAPTPVTFRTLDASDAENVAPGLVMSVAATPIRTHDDAVTFKRPGAKKQAPLSHRCALVLLAAIVSQLGSPRLVCVCVYLPVRVTG